MFVQGDYYCFITAVSVPIRGLFNLTLLKKNEEAEKRAERCFRPHQGII